MLPRILPNGAVMISVAADILNVWTVLRLCAV